MPSVFRKLLLAGLLAVPALASAQTAPAQTGTAITPATQTTPTTTFTVTVVGTTPLGGVDLPVDQIPAPVQTATSRDLEQSGALDVAAFLNTRVNGVHVNEVQGNPFQPDVNYRGYTASPLLGTPQGLSVYMDGVRLNQPFGEVVSWDLIPRVAIHSTALMPGSNPLFGLNTLGGALSIQTKDGRTSRGTTILATYGSDLRRAVEFEHGGSRAASGIDWYVAGNLFAEDGWRDNSPSDLRQLFGKLAWRRPLGELSLSVAHADNALSGNGLQETGFLDHEYGSVYTTPDQTDNRSTLLNVAGRRALSDRLAFAANAYYRLIRTKTLNGDINEDSLDQNVYRLGAALEPFPFLRCLEHVALNDEPGEQCNGLINRSHADQRNGGFSAQITRADAVRRGSNRVTAGIGFDGSGVGFVQSTELGYLNPDRGVTGTGAFADGVTGGTVDGEPFDSRVDLDGTVRTFSVYASDTWSPAGAWHITVSGRFNRTTVSNRDRITPGGEAGSLDGDHVFTRFNPAAGLTYNPSPRLNFYAGYSEGSRAATSIELGCANPEQPCKLPNAMAGDPPLDQVVTRSWDAGVRGRAGRVDWHAGAFHAGNDNDILFVTSEQTGFGYFRNFGETRRQGLEASLSVQIGRVTAGAGYTLLDATFQSEESVNGEGNSTNDAAAAGQPGSEGAIDIEPGDWLPLTPRHMLKLYADLQVTSALSVNVDVAGISSAFARGNENNRHEPDGVYYLGSGSSDGYAVVNLGARYRATGWLQVVGQIDNLLDRRYTTAAQLGALGFTDSQTFIARPFPAVNGEFPLRHSTFYAPGAPRRAWLGTRVTF